MCARANGVWKQVCRMQAVTVKSAAGRFSIRREVYKGNGQVGVSHRNNKITLECVCGFFALNHCSGATISAWTSGLKKKKKLK